jgi:hypothetical protein
VAAILQRYSVPLKSVSIGTDVPGATNGSTAIQYSTHAGGTLYFASTGSTGLTLLTWYASLDGTSFYPLQDGAGSAVTTTLPANTAVAVDIHALCAPSAWIAAVGNQSSGAVTCTANLKG